MESSPTSLLIVRPTLGQGGADRVTLTLLSEFDRSRLLWAGKTAKTIQQTSFYFKPPARKRFDQRLKITVRLCKSVGNEPMDQFVDFRRRLR